MAFSRDDLAAYEAKPQVEDPNHDVWGAKPTELTIETTPESSPEVVAESTVTDNDGSTTVTPAEPVAAESVTPEDVNEPEVEESADGRPRSRAQERITELVDERNAVKEYNKYLQSKLDELLRMQATKSAPESSPAAAPQPETDDTAPTLETADFDPIKLNKLQNEWIQKQVDKRVNSAIQQIETRQGEAAIGRAFEARVVEFRKTSPDFDTVLANPALPKLAPEAARAVITSEQGPDLAYYLGKNPDVAVRISKMTPAEQSYAIGRLEGQLSRKTAPAADTKEPSKVTPAAKPAAVTKAPPPPKPVSGGSPAPITKEMAQMTMEEWVAHERNRKIVDRQAKQRMRQSMR